jgi:2-dehydro-3-deoxygluconokinase
MKPYDLTTIGEIMLRFSVPAGERLELATQLDVRPGGAEANVAAVLARLGRATAWCGSLPASALGRLVANHLRMAGVATEGIVWSERGRMGTYFVEFTAPPRSIQVIYDRADSCAARLTAAEVKWDWLLATRLLHLTGITPALSLQSLTITQEAMTRARAAGIPVSFDVNYRAKLWPPDDAARVLLSLATGVDLLFCGQGDAQRLFGCRGEPHQVVAQLAEKTQAQRVVVTFGDAGVVGWDGANLHEAPALPVQIVDRLGAGDALAAGVIHGWLDGDFAQGLRYGVALAALALSQHGDMVVTTPEELAALVASVGGLIER